MFISLCKWRGNGHSSNNSFWVFISYCPNNDSLMTQTKKQTAEHSLEATSKSPAVLETLFLHIYMCVCVHVYTYVLKKEKKKKTSGFFFFSQRNKNIWPALQKLEENSHMENHRTGWKAETDLWECRGSWVRSPDSADLVLQARAGSPPGALWETVRGHLACLWTGLCPEAQQSTPQRQSAPHRGGHLDSEIFKMKLCYKGNMHEQSSSNRKLVWYALTKEVVKPSNKCQYDNKTTWLKIRHIPRSITVPSGTA